MGSRLGKRKRLGVPDKSTEEKAERAAMEMEGTPQESPETHLAAETALNASQVMGKAPCTEEPASGTTEETEIQTVTKHGEAQPSAETTEGNESQPEAQMLPAVPQITETHLDPETSEHTSEAQPIEESSLDPTDETEAATEHDEPSPTGETTEMTETQLNALYNQGTEAQFAGEIHPTEISVLKIEDQPTAQTGEEIEVPVAMPTMQEPLREAEPAAQTPQMTSEAVSVVETALASTDVIAAQLAVQDAQLGEMQLAEVGESQKVIDHAEACSTAEPVEVMEAQPASASTYKSLQDTEGSQPLAEKSLEPTEVSEVPSEETIEGNESQPEVELPPAVPQITETHLDPETSEHTSEAQPIEESSLDPTDETEAATEHDELSPTGETTEMTETQLNALHNQETEAQFAGEIHPIEISVLKIEDQPTAQTGEEIEVPVAMPTMQEPLREAEPAAQTPQMTSEAVSVVETALASTDVIAAQLAVQDAQLGEMQLAEVGESQKVIDHAEACSTAEPVEVMEAQPASASTYKSLQDTEGSQPLAEKSLEPTEVSEVPSEETIEGNESQPEVELPPAVPQITETHLDPETSEHTSEAQPIEESSLDPTDETEAATEHDELSPTGETTEMTETQLNALHNQETEAQFAGEIHPIEISVLKIEDQPTAQNGEETEVPVAMPTVQEAEPAAQTPQMTGEAASIIETALASTDVIAAQLAVQDTQLGEMQLAEVGESQKVTDHAEACSTAEPVEVTETQPASASTYKSIQDTEGSQPLAEKSLELTEVSEVHSIAQAIEETNEGQQIAQAIEAEAGSIEETSQTTEITIGAQPAAVTTGEPGEAPPTEPPSIAEVAEAQNAAENSEDQPSSETTEVTKTLPVALHAQKTKAVAGEGQPAIETSEVMADPQPTMLGKPDTEAHKTVQSTKQIGEGPTALPTTQGILHEPLPAAEAQQAVEILEESLHVTGGAQLLAETESQNTTENSEAHPVPETETVSVPNTLTPQEVGAWPIAETAKAAEGKSTEDMVLNTAKVENQAHPNTKVREAMEIQAAGTDTQESPREAETMRETVTQSTERSMPEGGGAWPTAEAARVKTAAPIAQKSEPATETTAGNSESCPIVQATEEMAVPPVAETEIQETEVQFAAQTAEMYTTALTILKFIEETSEAAAKTTEANEVCTIPGTVLETPEEAESLQSLMETTELKAKRRGQDPQIPANITEDQEGGEHAAISQEEILKASEQEISVAAEQDPAASLGASCELPQTLEPRSKTQAFQPLQSIVTAVDERRVQGEPKQSLSASETQGRKSEMTLHSDCGPIGSEAVPSKEIFAREAPDLIHLA